MLGNKKLLPIYGLLRFASIFTSIATVNERSCSVSIQPRLKAWMGATHFEMKTLDHVSTEMSLHVLAYNLKGVMKTQGIGPLMQAMRA